LYEAELDGITLAGALHSMTLEDPTPPAHDNKHAVLRRTALLDNDIVVLPDAVPKHLGDQLQRVRRPVVEGLDLAEDGEARTEATGAFVAEER
jgi:hypothetical protein